MIYRIVNLIVTAVAGPVASRLFQRTWRRLSGEEVQPDPTDRSRTWRAIVVSAALRGAILAVVTALLRRAAVTAVEVATDSPRPVTG